jgi:hypothetical protein
MRFQDAGIQNARRQLRQAWTSVYVPVRFREAVWVVMVITSFVRRVGAFTGGHPIGGTPCFFGPDGGDGVLSRQQ